MPEVLLREHGVLRVRLAGLTKALEERPADVVAALAASRERRRPGETGGEGDRG